MISAMLDLETLGTKHDAAILSIGMVAFNDDEIIGSFYAVLNNPTHGSIDASTVMWWLDQSEKARRSLLDADHVRDTLVVTQLTDFFNNHRFQEVWANSPSFDLTILESWWNRVAPLINWPLKFSNYRDFRTLNKLAIECGCDVGRISPELSHNALSDATAQAQYVIAQKKRFKEK